jgi:hypothetical protein
MFSNESLSIVIGLIFIYLLYSLLATILQEILATHIQLRGLVLRRGIRVLLGDSRKQANAFSGIFYKHPLIKNLKTGNALSKCPDYIDPQAFSKVVIDLLRGKEAMPGDQIRVLIQESLTSRKPAWDKNVTIKDDTHVYLNTIWTDAQGDVQKFRALLEEWFNRMMDKTTEWYKFYTQIMLLVIGLMVAVFFNVDTITIVKKLENNPDLAEKVVSQASDFIKAHPNLEEELKKSRDAIASMKIDTNQLTSLQQSADQQYQQNKRLRDSLISNAQQLLNSDISKVNDLLALGWKDDGCYIDLEDGQTWGRAIFGWLLTALAISLGAPFWFDLLKKLMQLRAAVATPKKETTAASATDTSVKITDRVG